MSYLKLKIEILDDNSEITTLESLKSRSYF